MKKIFIGITIIIILGIMLVLKTNILKRCFMVHTTTKCQWIWEKEPGMQPL